MDQKPSKVYRIHRENQRERILEVAERLFIDQGIDQVSVSNIAQAARMTRATLYEYFPNKQEVAWAIFQKMAGDSSTGQLLNHEGSGFQRVEHFMLLMVDLAGTHPEHFRFIVEFNTLYAREGNPTRVRQVWAEGGDRLARIIRQGIDDGSIRPDLDPDMLSAAVLNLLSGMNSRFALLGDLISEEYGQPVLDIYQEICRAFLRGIQSTPYPQENAG